MSSAPATPSGPVQLALVVDNDADHDAAPHADHAADHAAAPHAAHAAAPHAAHDHDHDAAPHADHAAAPHADHDRAHAPTAPPSWGHALLERHLDELVATARESGSAFYDRSDGDGEILTQLDAALERILRTDPEAAAVLGSSKLATERACVVAVLLEDVRAGDVPDDFERRLFAPLGIDPSAWDTPAELADDAHDETQHMSDGGVRDDEDACDDDEDACDDDEDTHEADEAHEAPTADNGPEAA